MTVIGSENDFLLALRDRMRADPELLHCYDKLKTFGVVVDVPGRPGHYCAAVDKAMDLKLKRDRATARRP